VNGLSYEVARTADIVTNVFSTILYNGIFHYSPVFVADMQTCDGVDTASVRWKNRDEVGIDVRISKEQSKTLGVNHATEVVGYMLFSKTK
jgi:hypothetical protein